MAVATKSVTGRRKVRFESLDELMADARRLAAGDISLIGNWSLGQILQHLAVSFNGSIDGINSRLPWLIRIALTFFMKRKFLEDALPAGYQIPSAQQAELVAADTTTTEAGLAALEAAVERLKTESRRAPHPGFGPLSIEEWNKFHLRHAELHLSFVHFALAELA